MKYTVVVAPFTRQTVGSLRAGLAFGFSALAWACGGGDTSLFSESPSGGASSGAAAGVGGFAGAAPGSGAGHHGGEGVGAGDLGGEGPGLGGGTCDDKGSGEPNGNDAEATEIPGPPDCDKLHSFGGTIRGLVDLDWYSFVQSENSAFCFTDPAVAWFESTGDALRVCMYIACVEGTTSEFTCEAGSTPASVPAGKGCCGTTDFHLGNVTCMGGQQIVRALIEVGIPDADAHTCVDYHITYRL